MTTRSNLLAVCKWINAIGAFASVGALLGITVWLWLNIPLDGIGVFAGVVGTLALALVFAYIAYWVWQTYSWIELDGKTIRTKHFWTRTQAERRIEDICDVRFLDTSQGPALATDSWWTAFLTLGLDIVAALPGPVKGYEIRFQDRGRVCLNRQTMADADLLMDAIRLTLTP